MAFLDNSGDIILDAVLTDAGRRRLARADGSFKITKFALGDDEIDYSIYNLNHLSGSAFEDLQILQTPVLEAFTNSSTQLKSRLLTYLDNSKFYLPIIAINELEVASKRMGATQVYGVAVSKTSRDAFSTVQGVMDGFDAAASKTFIHLDQGLDTEAIDPSVRINAEDVETQYTIQIDNRLGSLTSIDKSSPMMSFIDSDDIATYYLTLNANPNFVTQNTNQEQSTSTEIIRGPRGTTLKLKIQSSLNLRRSKYLFDKIGATTTLNDKDGSSQNIRYIDSTVKITGATTGFSLDVPVRFIKLTSED